MSTTFFATCARGLEHVLAKELHGIGAQNVQTGRGGVDFQGDLQIVYRANLWLRTAVRVLRPLLRVNVFNPDQLYDAVRSIDWAEHMTPDHTLAVDCNVRDSAITHSQYAARRVKDAICDQFRERVGRRPSVNTEQPGIGLNLHISRNHAILSLDSSWNSLHKRGYRPIQTRAPLNESLAAGLLLHLGYDGSEPLHDPLCGSGTFAIEAAWIALNRPPGLTRKWFGFFGWMDYDISMWSAIREEARRGILNKLPASIVGTDIRFDAMDFADHNARSAGVGHLIRLEKRALKDNPLSSFPSGLLICNPPYGERLGDEQELIPLYRDLGEVAKSQWPGWRLGLLTSNDFLAKQIRLPIRRRTPFYNGSLPCHLWEFDTQ